MTPAIFRLRKHADFQRVYQASRKQHSRQMSYFFAARPDGGLQRPLNHRLRERVATGRYGGGMPTDAARKDSTLALELAQRHRVPLFAIQAAHTPYELAVADGLGRDDYAAIAKLWQAWTGRALAGDGGGDGNGDGDGAGGARG